MTLTEYLISLRACEEARDWASQFQTLEDAWDACERPDWMFWLVGHTNTDKKTIVLAACACARLALPHVPAGEERPRLAIEAAEGWARGEVPIEEVREARNASAAAASAASAAYAAYAAAAYAASAAAYAAAAASYAASAASAASAAYAAYAAYAAAKKACCAEIRKICKCPEMKQ